MPETQAAAKRNIAWVIRRAAMQMKRRGRSSTTEFAKRRGHALLQAAEFMRSPRDHRLRRSVGQEYIAHTAAPPMDPAKGYGITSVEKFENFDAVVGVSRALFERKKRPSRRNSRDSPTGTSASSKCLKRKDKFLRNLLNDKDLQRNPELLDFALSDPVLGMAARYLGAIPYLCRVDIVYSLPRASEDNIASQLFHVDPEGLTQVKFFIHLYDVGEPEGPFTFIRGRNDADSRRHPCTSARAGQAARRPVPR